MNEPQTARPRHPGAGEVRIATLVRSPEGERRARLMIDSLRTFGGAWSNCPVWVFVPVADRISGNLQGLEGVEVLRLDVEDALRRYLFGDKVAACARAEELARPDTRTLIWLDPGCLIVNPPALFDLAPAHDAAFRPVHIQNVGSAAGEPLDEYWQGVYGVVGIEEVPFTVESFVDRKELRPYLNSHCYSLNPSAGLSEAWLECFRTLVADHAFQAAACRDDLHQVFLHQAILSGQVTKRLDRERLRLLPPEYSYPLHFQQEVPEARRAATLNVLACAVYEEAADLGKIPVDEPLRSWLADRPLDVV